MPPNSINVTLVYEDILQKEVCEKIITGFDKKYCIHSYLKGHGFGSIKNNINSFNSAASGFTYIVFIDLDNDTCAPNKISSWLDGSKSNNLLLRVAVKEIESWIIADKEHFQLFLGLRHDLIPDNVDRIPDPKAFLFDLVKKSKKSHLIRDICPKNTARLGPLYNETLSKFVWSSWDPNLAQLHSPSLNRTIKRFKLYSPDYS